MAVVDAAAFGVVGDGRMDDTRAIQGAIDWALERGIPSVALPPGRFRTTDTLHLGYGEEFRTIALHGSGEFSYRGVTAGTTIAPENTTRPAINVQGGRGSAIRNVAILGRNYDFLRDRTSDPAAIGEADPDRWLDPVLKNGLSRYSPYAAITVDAFSGQDRAGSDFGAPPLVPYLHQQPDSGPRAFSSDVIIDRCWIGGFAVAIAVQPCDGDGNGDFVRVNGCYIENTVYGISVGNSQSRNVGVRDCVYARVHTFVTNKTFGRGVGTLGGVFDNISGFRSYQFMDVAASRSQPITVTSLYFESQGRIGRWSDNAELNHTVLFQTCNFYLSESVTGVAGNCLLECGRLGSVRFVGCSFQHARRIYNLVRGASQVTIEDCLIGPVDDFRGSGFFAEVPEHIAKALEYTAGGAFVHSDAMGSRVRLVGGNLGLSFSAGITKASMQAASELMVAQRGKRLRVHHYARAFLDRFGVIWRIRHKREPFPLEKRVDGKWLKSISYLPGGRIELVLSAQAQTRPEMYTESGDIVYDSDHGTIFVVSRVDSETARCVIVAHQMNDFNMVNNDLKPNSPDLGSSGYLWLYRCNTLIGDAVFEGEFTSGSEIVRDVRCGPGDSSGLELALATGELLYEGRCGSGSTMPPYPSMTRVIGVDAAAAEVRLNKPARSGGPAPRFNRLP